MGTSTQLPQSTWLASHSLPPSKLWPHGLPPTFPPPPTLTFPAPPPLLSSPFPDCSSSLVPCSLLCPPPQTRMPGGACKKGLPTPLHYLQNRPYLSSRRGFLTAHLQAPSSQERSPPALYPPASRGQNHCPKLSRSPEPLTSSGSVAEGNQVVERPSLRQRDFLLHPGRQCNESTYMWTRGQKEVQ